MKICIDMDGVLCDFVESANKRAKEIWGIEINKSDVESCSFARAVQNIGVKLTRADIYKEIMAPGLFSKLEPLPGAIEAVKQLIKDGHEITILTKALVIARDSHGRRIVNDHVLSEKLDWLAEHFGDIRYSVIMTSSMKDKHLVNAHVLVDDDPRALDHPSAITICVAQPWNKRYRNDLGSMQTTIYHMSELPEKIEFVERILRTKNELEEDIFSQMEKEVGINESKTIKPGSSDSSD